VHFAGSFLLSSAFNASLRAGPFLLIIQVGYKGTNFFLDHAGLKKLSISFVQLYRLHTEELP